MHTKSVRTSRITLVLLLVFSGVSLHSDSNNGSNHVSYWLWAGLEASDAPANSELYVYQGRIKTVADMTSYERLGLYPYPIKSSKLLLVYRLEGGLPDAKDVLDVFQRSVAQWQRHPVTVTGIQLDFDSPTSKLLIYSQFVEEVRKQLPKNCELSVTGLGDWAISGNEGAMRSISSSTDEIVFQLYQGRRPLPDIEQYLKGLANYQFPFRIGLLSGFTISKSVDRLKANPNYRGIIYFVQRAV
jgi:hypothetical protein